MEAEPVKGEPLCEKTVETPARKLTEEEMVGEIQTAVADGILDQKVLEQTNQRKTICINCNTKPEERPKRCTACAFFYYCSVECQKQHWTAHKIACKKFVNQVQLYPSRDVVPLWYIYYCLGWIKIEEFLFEAKKHRQNVLSSIQKSFAQMKEVTPTADLLVSWIPSMITIDGNSKHLVIYLSYPYWNETEEVECYSEQFLFEIYLVGPEKAKHSHHFGNSVVYSVKQN